MRKLLLAMSLVPALSLAAEEKPATPTEDPMAGWVSPKVTNEARDKQEIQAVFKAMETAATTGDLDAAVALVDFPVMMITDDSRGEAMGEPWTRERWTAVMKPFYGNPPTEMKVTHEPSIFLLSDSLASVDDVATMTSGGKTITSRNSMFLIRRDGKWRVKMMAEGGWGDMMAASRPTAGGAQPSGSEGTGSAAGAQGTEGSGAQPPPATAPPRPPGAGGGGRPERTTK